jgi:hypothetical protein
VAPYEGLSVLTEFRARQTRLDLLMSFRPFDELFGWHCQVEAFSQNTGARTVVMPRWSRCAIAPPLLIGRSEASTGRRDGAGG